ncbi:ABC-type amino acid transport substrate-binding protein [Duganella sp. 1224]|uniref:substrate-binding periplasmic protein n=1 Tax=Duganella sp. 1224 TaxID=2587052 RepID=UPI0015CB5CA2|nr:transporter substrate-binding domain-containing protein [Duganella sp. 1224]NYE63183.1 ABC-type amino acid transport substrate-binding protein [Duganella sp. 1224]
MLARLALALLLTVTASSPHAADKTPLRYLQKVDGMLTPDQQQITKFQDQLGAALARQLKRPLQYIELPRRRLMAALENGDGDILCSYLPEWLPGAVDWTRAFIPTSEVVLSSPRVKAPATLTDLRGQRLGTVLGYQYPELEKFLGNDYVRDDAPTSMMSVRKWLAGRVDYLVTQRTTVNRQLAAGGLPDGYHMLVVYEVKAKCAVSRKSQITVEEVNAAINAMEKSGELAGILRLR